VNYTGPDLWSRWLDCSPMASQFSNYYSTVKTGKIIILRFSQIKKYYVEYYGTLFFKLHFKQTNNAMVLFCIIGIKVCNKNSNRKIIIN